MVTMSMSIKTKYQLEPTVVATKHYTVSLTRRQSISRRVFRLTMHRCRRWVPAYHYAPKVRRPVWGGSWTGDKRRSQMGMATPVRQVEAAGASQAKLQIGTAFQTVPPGFPTDELISARARVLCNVLSLL